MSSNEINESPKQGQPADDSPTLPTPSVSEKIHPVFVKTLVDGPKSFDEDQNTAALDVGGRLTMPLLALASELPTLPNTPLPKRKNIIPNGPTVRYSTMAGVRMIPSRKTGVGARMIPDPAARFTVAGARLIPDRKTTALPLADPLPISWAAKTDTLEVATQGTRTEADVVAEDFPPPASRPDFPFVVAVFCFALALLAVAIAFFVSTSSDSPMVLSPRAPAVTISSVREVVLNVSTDGATVFSEDSGRELGTAPLKFLLPPGSNTAVIVAAKGHEPQRVVLPDRGRVQADLVPLSSASCMVDIETDADGRLQGYNTKLRSTGPHRIPGAALARADGEGAWILRCSGKLRRQTLETTRHQGRFRLQVAGPAGARAHVDGKDAGVLPLELELSARLINIEIETSDGKLQRWVPVFSDTIVEMPQPVGN